MLAIVLSLGLSYVHAWTAPTVSPPGGNTAAPLNTSLVAQVKYGGLVIDSLGIANIAAGALNVLGGANIGGSVGIGTTTTNAAKLTVVGTVKITGGIPGAGKVLTSDATGLASWVAPSSGGVTSISQGTGITLSPNPITTTGTVSVNTTSLQSRVTGSCATNQAISVINSNGSVSCSNVIPPAAVCTFNSKTYTTGAICNSSTTYDSLWLCNDTTTATCSSTGSWVSNSCDCGGATRCTWYTTCGV